MIATVPMWLVIVIAFTAGFTLRPLVKDMYKNPNKYFDFKGENND